MPVKLKKSRFRPQNRVKRGGIQFTVEAAPIGHLHRDAALRGNFEACVRYSARGTASHMSVSCARAKNPRAALAKALRKFANKTAKRKGAFARFAGRK